MLRLRARFPRGDGERPLLSAMSEPVRGLDRLQALVLLLISSSTLLELYDHCGVDADTAAEHASWAIQALIAATVAGAPAAREAPWDRGHER